LQVNFFASTAVVMFWPRFTEPCPQLVAFHFPLLRRNYGVTSENQALFFVAQALELWMRRVFSDLLEGAACSVAFIDAAASSLHPACCDCVEAARVRLAHSVDTGGDVAREIVCMMREHG